MAKCKRCEISPCKWHRIASTDISRGSARTNNGSVSKREHARKYIQEIATNV